MKNRKAEGFTLIELLIVIAIIGILAAVLIPNLLGARQRAYDTGAQACASALGKAAAAYQIDNPGMTVYPGSATLTADTAAYGTNQCTGITVVDVTTPAFSSSHFAYKTHDSRGKNYFTVTESGITTSAS